jgi:class 3 adenylate cyclase/predicted metal-dependent HD superfamily phosphohydrolase
LKLFCLLVGKLWWTLGISAAGSVLIFFIWNRLRIIRISNQKKELEQEVRKRTAEIEAQKSEIEKQNALLASEKEKVEKLLSNILPKDTIDELKTKGKATARHFRLASVMFTDFQGFTQISSKLRPSELVEALDAYFIKFDEIASKYNIEQIKTIGDSYMCAGGLPIRNRSNPIDIILAAFEILRYVEQQNKQKRANNEDTWNLRVGIHSGEVIAGVIGTRRFAYDIWGDTVNIASALEHFGEPGKINISGNTFHLVKDFFDCTFRDKIKTKSPDEVEMYFVNKIKKELSENGEGVLPNTAFREKLKSDLDRKFNYKKAEQHIVKLLKIKLPEGLHYHGLHHTFDVCNAAERIAKSEGVDGEDLFLLLTAALIHDAGFTVTYANHEDQSVVLAKEILPQYGYSDKQLKVIEGIINATKLPMNAQTQLEKIMCDADLDYLGRADFYPIAEGLKKEFMAQKIVANDKEFDAIQIKFLTTHTYFTQTSKTNRDPEKQQRLIEIKARYEKYS